MIRVSVMYPRTEGAAFDMDYYMAKHMPMVRDRLGAACKGIEVDVGLGGGLPGSPAPYVVTAHMLFDSVQAFEAAFNPHGREIMADIANYTTIGPRVQVSEIRLQAG